MHPQSTPTTPPASPDGIDLSPKGVEAVVAALAAAGLTVHYTETDGDTTLDLHLRPVDDPDTNLISLSWRQDRRGWYLAEHDSAGVQQCTWPLSDLDVADVASEAARILAQVERAEAQMRAGAEQAADTPTTPPATPASPAHYTVTIPGAYEAATAATEPDSVRARLAAELHRIAAALVHQDLPIGDRALTRLNIGVLATRADLERWTEYLGSAVEVDPNGGIQFTAHRIPLDGWEYGADLTVQAQVAKGGAQ